MMVHLSRRTFLKGLVVTTAGLLLPAEVAAEPTRRIWQLDQTHLGQGDRVWRQIYDETAFFSDPGREIVWISAVDNDRATVVRGLGSTTSPFHAESLIIAGPGHFAPGDFVLVDAAGAHPLGVSGPDTAFARTIAHGISDRVR